MPDLFHYLDNAAEGAIVLGRFAGEEPTDPLLARAVELVLEDRARLMVVEQLAGQVRAAQKRYFNRRDNLDECKRLERKLDTLLRG